MFSRCVIIHALRAKQRDYPEYLPERAMLQAEQTVAGNISQVCVSCSSGNQSSGDAG